MGFGRLEGGEEVVYDLLAGGLGGMVLARDPYLGPESVDMELDSRRYLAPAALSVYT